MITDEITTALNQSIANNGIDESELDDELAELQQEKLDEDMLKTSVPVGDRVGRMPSAPVRTPAKAEEEDEEAELLKLQAEMAI